MFFHKREDRSYVAVALAMILVGAAILAYGAIGWFTNVGAQEILVPFPSLKVMGGVIIIALGYIQLELGLLRKK